MRAPRLLEPLRQRDYALLWSGQALSTLGNLVVVVVLPWQVLTLTGSPFQIGVLAALENVAGLALLLPAGAIVDRVPRRRVLLTSDLASALVTTAIAILSLRNELRIEHLYAAAVYYGASFSFFLPAFTAIVPELVPGERLQQANALRQVSVQVGRILGPGLGGFLASVLGFAAAFAFDALSFLVGAATLLLVRSSTAPAATGRRVLADVRDGLRFTFSATWLWVAIFGFSLVVAGLQASWAVGMPTLVRDALSADAATLGAIFAALGAGELVGAAAVGQLGVRRVGVAMYGLVALSGLALAGIGLFPALLPILLLAAVVGAGFVGSFVLWSTLLQRRVPRELLGRVSSVDSFGALLLAPVSPLASGLLVDRFGAPAVFVGGGALILTICIASLAVPSIRSLD